MILSEEGEKSYPLKQKTRQARPAAKKIPFVNTIKHNVFTFYYLLRLLLLWD